MSTSEAKSDRYRNRVLMGQCGRCGGDLPSGYTKRNCRGCLGDLADRERDRFWARRGEQAPPRKKLAQTPERQYERARYEDRKARGLCARCPATLPKGSLHVCCAACRTRNKVVNEKCRGKRPATRPRPSQKRLAAMPRCRCGLLLPCNNCVGSIDGFASRRLTWDVGW